MAEVGCLRDANFQNLNAQQIMLGNNTLRVAGFVNLDSGGDDALAVPATGLTANSVHIIGGNGTGGAVTVTLPTGTAVPNVGDFYTFLIGAQSTTGHEITIGAATDKLVGGLQYIRVPATGLASAVISAAGAATVETNAVYITPNQNTTTDDRVFLDANAADGGGVEGTWITFTYIGTPYTTDGTLHTWYMAGQIITIDPNGTGAGVFIAPA
jgi:hypothetical protein